jgi:hypothetical protein
MRRYFSTGFSEILNNMLITLHSRRWCLSYREYWNRKYLGDIPVVSFTSEKTAKSDRGFSYIFLHISTLAEAKLLR